MVSRRIFQVVSWLALAGTIVPSMIFLGGSTGLGPMKSFMLLAAIVWFVATPLWMGRAKAREELAI